MRGSRSPSATAPRPGPPSAAWTTPVLEGLWLAAIFLVPVVFAPPGTMIDLFQVSKVTLLRTLVGLMAMVWMLGWALRSSPARFPDVRSAWPRLWASLRRDPANWVAVAAAAFFAANVLSTLYSTSMKISLWGKVPAGDGYALYTTASYALLFAVIATHLRSVTQLWRLLGAIAAAGVMVAVYGVAQEVGLDPFALSASSRVTTTLGNAVFAGAFLAVTIPVTLGFAAGRISWANLRWVLPSASAALVVQTWVLVLTLSRAPWLGVGVGVVLFVLLASTITGRVGRTVIVGVGIGAFVLTAVLTVGVNACYRGADSPLCTNRVVARVISVTQLLPGKPNLVVERPVLDGPNDGEGPGGTDNIVAEQEFVAERAGNERLLMWSQTLSVIADRPGLGQERGALAFLLPVVGYGPELFRYVFPLGSGGELENTLGSVSYAHNHLLHTWVELGVIGLVAHVSFLASIFVAGALVLGRGAVHAVARRWVVVTILAAVASWVVQGMFGIARIGDLTMFWALAAAFVALPRVFGVATAAERIERPGRAPRSARAAARKPAGARMAIGLVVVVLLLGLTWTKNVNYAVAEMRTQDSLESFKAGAFPRMVEDIDASIALAPDAYTYYEYKAQIYAGARIVPGADIDPLTFVELRYEASRSAVEQNPYAVAAQHSLAEAAWDLYKAGQEDKLPEAIRHLTAMTTLRPNNYTAYNRLAEAYLNSGQPQAALDPLLDSLAITWGPDGLVRLLQRSGVAFYLQGLAYRELGDAERALASLDQSLLLTMDTAQVTHARQVVEELRDT